jgi:hypothetical protein
VGLRLGRAGDLLGGAHGGAERLLGPHQREDGAEGDEGVGPLAEVGDEGRPDHREHARAEVVEEHCVGLAEALAKGRLLPQGIQDNTTLTGDGVWAVDRHLPHVREFALRLAERAGVVAVLVPEQLHDLIQKAVQVLRDGRVDGGIAAAAVAEGGAKKQITERVRREGGVGRRWSGRGGGPDGRRRRRRPLHGTPFHPLCMRVQVT